MAKAYQQYIDTDIHGLVNVIAHNLNGQPFVSIIIVEDGTDKLLDLPLSDSLIGEVEFINYNEVKVTFTDTFKGYFRALLADVRDLSEQIADNQEDINFIYTRLDTMVPYNKWTQMNALRDKQISDLNDEIDDLDTRLQSLKNRVDNL